MAAVQCLGGDSLVAPLVRGHCVVGGSYCAVETQASLRAKALSARHHGSAYAANFDGFRQCAAELSIACRRVAYRRGCRFDTDFGAFVNFMGGRDGLVHISELAQSRVNKTEDVVKLGDVVQVKVLGFDDRGKIKLSMKAVNQG